jgi:2-polyprenyl-3-methyl-5-hydroxy-6-metoxy-1,4-benzoquinol methylase
MFEAPGGQFGSIVFSEVLEHLEQPEQALQTIRRLLAPGGRAFINAPVNSPAPDHLKLFRTPEEIIDMIQDAGLAVEQTLFAPTNGLTLAQARKRSSTISTAAIVRKPA